MCDTGEAGGGRGDASLISRTRLLEGRPPIGCGDTHLARVQTHVEGYNSPKVAAQTIVYATARRCCWGGKHTADFCFLFQTHLRCYSLINVKDFNPRVSSRSADPVRPLTGELSQIHHNSCLVNIAR